jgi:hypothetical protein
LKAAFQGPPDLPPRINSIRVALQGIVVVALLVVGVYGIVWTQTSPSDQPSVINAILGGENNILATGVTNGGDTIKAGVGFQYILMFKTASATCCNQGPSGYTLPTGGSMFGPLAWTSPNDTASSYDRRYAVFTDSFSFQPSPSGCCPFWFSGPDGNISQPFLKTGRYGGVEQYAGVPGGFGWATSIFEVNSPGNYTLHFTNSGAVGNVTGRVAMGASTVTYSRTQPYLYLGIGATAFAVIFAAVAGLVYRRKPSSTAIKN